MDRFRQAQFLAFRMNLQTRYDLEVATDEIVGKVERDVQPLTEIRG